MELAGRLDQLTAAELAPIVRRAVGDSQAWPLTWEFDTIDWTGNLATVALIRLTGMAQTKRVAKSPGLSCSKSLPTPTCPVIR
jgi:hypothetical protein